MSSDDTLERLFALLAREVDSTAIEVVAADSDVHGDIEHRMLDGRRLVVRLASQEDLPTKQRRLDMLVEAFSGSIESTPPPKPSQNLASALALVASRAGALGAVVIDAQSPVIWATSLEGTPHNVFAFDRASGPPSVEAKTISKVLEEVRALPQLASLRKGMPLEIAKWASFGGYYVRSLASIYLLILIFTEPFDERRVEPLVTSALPQIERMILALPPLQPPDGSGAAAMRKMRR